MPLQNKKTSSKQKIPSQEELNQKIITSLAINILDLNIDKIKKIISDNKSIIRSIINLEVDTKDLDPSMQMGSVKIHLSDFLLSLPRMEDSKREDKVGEILTILIKNGLDVSKLDDEGKTHIFNAATRGQNRIIKSLLASEDTKKSINLKSNDGVTALYAASQNGYKKVVISLLDNDAAIDSGTSFYTPLYAAASCNNNEIVKTLISPKYASKFRNLKNKDGVEALHVASESGHHEIVEMLTKIDGLDVNYIHEISDTAAIHAATKFGHLQAVKTLISAGADVNLKISNSETRSLHIASEMGYLKIAEALLEKSDDDINTKQEGKSAIILASTFGHSKIVDALLKSPKLSLEFSEPILCALENGNFDIAEKLFKLSNPPMPISLLVSFAIKGLNELPADSIEIYKIFEALFEILENDDQKKEFVTSLVRDRPVLIYAIENNNYNVAKLIYKNSCNFYNKSEDDLEQFQADIFSKLPEIFKFEGDHEQLQGDFFSKIPAILSDEDEFDEFLDLFCDKSGLEPKRKELSETWRLFRDNKIDELKDVIKKDPKKIFEFKYTEKVDKKFSPKTFLHRLAEDKSDKSLEILKYAIKALEIKRESFSVDLLTSIERKKSDVEEREVLGRVDGITPMYFAINSKNIEVVKLLMSKGASFNSPIKYFDYKTEELKSYSIFELALEMATSKKGDAVSFEILEIVAGKNDYLKKARFPNSSHQLEKIARNFENYDPKIKKLLEAEYPQGLKLLSEYSAKEVKSKKTPIKDGSQLLLESFEGEGAKVVEKTDESKDPKKEIELRGSSTQLDGKLSSLGRGD
jgi:ankyrin repeat protein